MNVYSFSSLQQHLISTHVSTRGTNAAEYIHKQYRVLPPALNDINRRSQYLGTRCVNVIVTQ